MRAAGRPRSTGTADRVARFGTDDVSRLSWSECADGVREETWCEPRDGRPLRKVLSRGG